jgi:hypothetical protein
MELKRLLANSTSGNTEDEASAEAPERRVLSQKEFAKEKRHAMYVSAKERRATDPRYLAMKEAVKVQRRAVYQKVKEQRKTVAAAEKAKRKELTSASRASKRGEADRELAKLVTNWVTKGSVAEND